MSNVQAYPIGIEGKKWGELEKKQWFEKQSLKRSYQSEVVDKIMLLQADFDIEQYGALSIDKHRYPLFVIKSPDFCLKKPTVLITGGVHGYETSGVQGALLFLTQHGLKYSEQVNLIVAPCISPWGYETINRWNNQAIDPNRSFYQNSPSEEAFALMKFMRDLALPVLAHFDLHETTDTDNSEFRPALAARDATVHDNWNIPDGFYLVGNTANPQHKFQQAIIQSVEKITHIAPADDAGKLIGVPLSQFGVINYEARALGLCMGLTNADFTTTTEVYPDSAKVDESHCNLAQVAVITGGIDYILNQASI